MSVKKPETKSLSDLASALSRWDTEGGFIGASLRSDSHSVNALRSDEERILRCLGAAVIMQWNDLPTAIQRSLFDDAASMSDPDRQFQLKQQIARFLHVHKDDA